jgi:hypothetical protein
VKKKSFEIGKRKESKVITKHRCYYQIREREKRKEKKRKTILCTNAIQLLPKHTKVGETEQTKTNKNK